MLRELFPTETRLRVEDRDGHGDEFPLVANHQVRLAHPLALDQVVSDLGRRGGITLDDRFAGDIAERTVRVVGRHQNVLFHARPSHEDFLRQDFEFYDGVFTGIAELGAFGNPAQDCLVVTRARFDLKTAFVRDRLRRLGQHQTLLGGRPVDATPRDFVQQRVVIEFRVIAS